MNLQYDVIVVGGGGSGLAAAVSSAEQGLTVLLLEKQKQLGGTTGLAVGSFTANSTRMQQRSGIQDSPEEHAVDAGKFASPEIEARNHGELRAFFLAQTAATLHWLMDMGIAFHGPSPEPPNRVPRMHNVVPGAKAYIAKLHTRLLKLGGQVMVDAAVRELVRNSESGRVERVQVEVAGKPLCFQARRGMVLAAGDYANSPELIARFKGKQFASIEGINPGSVGDGHRLAESVGGQLVNMDVTYGPELRFVAPPGRNLQQLLPASGPLADLTARLLPFVPRFVMNAMIRRLLVTWQHPEDALLNDGALLVNREGQRFCDETKSPDREIAVAVQSQKQCYLLLDEWLIQRYSQWPHFISTAPKIAYAYVADYLQLRPDITAKAGSLEALAALRGLPERQLRVTVEEYNAATECRRSLEGDQWLLLGPAKAWFTTTEGGVAIDTKFRVLDSAGQPIPGLYAVGQNGLGGQILWGHGLHIAWAMTSGRLVGRELAESS